MWRDREKEFAWREKKRGRDRVCADYRMIEMCLRVERKRERKREREREKKSVCVCVCVCE